MENPVVLSLGKWPQQTFSRNFRTSPTTLRVINNVNIDIDSLLPLSFAQFVLENNLMNTSKNQIQELYQRQLERRKKKIGILHQIWIKAKQKRSKSAKNTFSVKSSCLVLRKMDTSKRYSSKSLHKQGNSKSKSPLFFKAKSPSKGSAYFDYYNTNNQKTKVNKKTSYQQQSTKSRKQKTSVSRNNEQYFNSSLQKKISQRQTTQPQQNLLTIMSKLMKKWSQLDKKHFEELQQFIDLTERERKRLLKIHNIQKQKLKKQIQNLRAKISSHKKLNKGITS